MRSAYKNCAKASWLARSTFGGKPRASFVLGVAGLPLAAVNPATDPSAYCALVETDDEVVVEDEEGGNG